MEVLFLVFGIIFVLLLVWGFFWVTLNVFQWNFESPQRTAGRRGEDYARSVIRSIMKEGDVLISNVSLAVEGKPTEFDNIVVNDSGVFIIEVKNYVGQLYGTEDDYEWIKYKTTGGGNTYEKQVKNPIKQVKRQIYILSRFFKNNNVNVWISGYVYFVHANSPIASSYVVASPADIDKAIHGKKAKGFGEREKRMVVELVEGLKKEENKLNERR
ncbi:MAG: NERD domain-containing protein [Paludibacteraceae bacterium]|nr:NERD domain-containing protein [Paludibacteraceae bacterium]